MPARIFIEDQDASADLALTLMQFSPATRAFIQIPCTGLSGTLDAVLTVYACSAGHKTKIAEVVLNVADNSDDVHSVNFSGSPEGLGFELAANGCTGGMYSILVSSDK